MKVKKRTLLLIACLVWSCAGFNVLRIGVLAYSGYLSVFYSGLGASLLLAGLLFGRNYCRAIVRP